MNNNECNGCMLDIENILNSNFSFGQNKDLDEFFKTVVKRTGYPYFNWNGHIFSVNNYQEGYKDTGINIDDIRKRDLVHGA